MMSFLNKHLLWLLLPVLLLSACKQRDNTAPVVATTDFSTVPNHFLQTPDEQPSLAAGNYDIVAATALVGQNGSYTLDIETSDGQKQSVNGSWSLSAGKDPVAAGNPHHILHLENAGGIKLQLHSSVDGYLYLLRNGQIIAQDDNGGGVSDALIDLPASKIDNDAYPIAYYKKIDPQNLRATLDGFKHKNGFDAGENAHVVFRDARDLGYGRNMHARRNSDGTFAFFVENYLVKGIPGASNYGPLNVEAAVREDRDHLVGINAIEFSPIDEADSNSEKILKFFTYRVDPEHPNDTPKRMLNGDLDGRGFKSMPGICLTCHGARILPLEKDGSFPVATLRSAKFNQLEVESFDYSSRPGFTRSELEPGIRYINEIVRDAYVDIGARAADEPGKWFSGYSETLANGRYDNDFSNALFNKDFVPDGWKQTFDRPEGVELLFKKVIEPHCTSCHALQGNAIGEQQVIDVNGKTVSLANAVNFSSYERFIANADRVTEYVFRRGWMPASLRNYEAFWKDPDGAPALLASYLPGFNLYDSNHKVHQAGAPFARPGVDRSAVSPVQLSGAASLFAKQYVWRVVSGPGEAHFDNVASAAPVFTASSDGLYQIELKVSNAAGISNATTLNLTVDHTVQDQHQLNFYDDIRPILGSADGSLCANCHNTVTAYTGIPVRYDDGNPHLYRDVLARVNLRDPENSRLIRKPTSLRHGGGLQIDTSTAVGKQKYETLLNWIREGAVCGNSAVVCD